MAHRARHGAGAASTACRSRACPGPVESAARHQPDLTSAVPCPRHLEPPGVELSRTSPPSASPPAGPASWSRRQRGSPDGPGFPCAALAARRATAPSRRGLMLRHATAPSWRCSCPSPWPRSWPGWPSVAKRPCRRPWRPAWRSARAQTFAPAPWAPPSVQPSPLTWPMPRPYRQACRSPWWHWPWPASGHSSRPVWLARPGPWHGTPAPWPPPTCRKRSAFSPPPARPRASSLTPRHRPFWQAQPPRSGVRDDDRPSLMPGRCARARARGRVVDC